MDDYELQRERVGTKLIRLFEAVQQKAKINLSQPQAC
jgi:hypothetical protein